MGANAETELQRLFGSDNARHRARALWLLGRIPNRGEHYVQVGLNDKDENIRCVAIRLAKQLGFSPSESCGKAAKDSSEAVRRELALALRFDTSNEMPAVWATFCLLYTSPSPRD